MKTKSIRQVINFKALPHVIYELLMDSRKHSDFTGEDARINREKGGTFTAYGEYISGKNLELIQDEKIVQSWRTSDWPDEYYSTVTYSLKKTKTGTRLVFSQEGVPAGQYKAISLGWKNFYWKPLKALLNDKG
ncbi:MAG: SRPBCC domain-containing protein [bacterium]|nr:SRPBCC domain-containing protein [bacterium]